VAERKRKKKTFILAFDYATIQQYTDDQHLYAFHKTRAGQFMSSEYLESEIYFREENPLNLY
jgi:hypothetical protein